MKEWWFSLNLREKQTIALGSAAVIATFLYGVLWSPLHDHVISLRSQVQHNQQLLAWMRNADEQIQAAEKAAPAAATTHRDTSWLSIVQEDLKGSSIANNVDQLVQIDNDSIKLRFKQVDFDSLIAWLTTLWQQEELAPAQLTIRPDNNAGIVTAEFTLKK